jgi:hypothetical protein
MNSAKNLAFSKSCQILRGVYPEPKTEILRFAQDDRRRVQDDNLGFFARSSFVKVGSPNLLILYYYKIGPGFCKAKEGFPTYIYILLARF